MSFSTKSIGIGLILGLVFGVVLGYSIQLNSVNTNPFEEQIDQLESHIRDLLSQIEDLESQVPILPLSDGDIG
jgi:hypothetical protein